MKTTLRPALFTAIAAVGLLAAGCSGTPAQSAASDDAPLTIWLMAGGPGETDIIDDINATFAEEYPDVEVTVEVQQWDNITTKLTTALASGNGPDIVEMGNTQTPLQTYSGGLLDITADRDSFEDSDTWLEGLAAPSEYDGKLYAVPMYGGTKIVMYNKAMFAEAGITELPQDLDELKDVCARLSQTFGSTPNFSGFYMPGQYWFSGAPFVFALDGELAAEDDGAWEGGLSTPEAQEGLAAWRDFQNSCSTPSSVGVNTNNPDQAQVFADRGTAIISARGWEPASVVEKNPELADQLGFMPMPGFETGTPLPVIVSGSTIGISAATDNPEAAKAWLRIITGKEIQTRLVLEQNQLPITPAFMPESGATPFIEASVEASKYNKALPAVPGWATLETERYNEQFFSSIAAGDDAAAAAKTYDAHVADVLNSTGN
ncbi:extracellular solute-binding protein [Microbacterium sp. NPDC058389]|uniref:extracellular solute-binding protein n=1 Tax=Microbacterium sp. NPDC058389 TaxID=3346475 RepID=UPI00364FE109